MHDVLVANIKLLVMTHCKFAVKSEKLLLIRNEVMSFQSLRVNVQYFQGADHKIILH